MGMWEIEQFRILRRRARFNKRTTMYTRLQWLACVLATACIVQIFLSSQVAAQDSPERFAEEIEAFEAWDRKNAWPEAPILFVGSSSIRLWSTAEAFPDLPVINRGFGGSQISDVNHYADRIVLKYKPRAIVFYAGDNDIAAGKSPEQVLEDFKTFVNAVRAEQPRVPIIYIAIKPSRSRWNLWSQMSRANGMIRQYATQDPALHFADIAAPMLKTGEPPAADLFVQDGLHLSEKGYAMWNDVLRASLRELPLASGN